MYCYLRRIGFEVCMVMLQAPADVETPEWGGIFEAATDGNSSEGPKEEKGAAPKSWRGLGEWQVQNPPIINYPCY